MARHSNTNRVTVVVAVTTGLVVVATLVLVVVSTLSGA